jgi:hypothetical protein
VPPRHRHLPGAVVPEDARAGLRPTGPGPLARIRRGPRRPPELAEGDEGHSDAGLMLGDAGNVCLFTCVTCDDRPSASVLESS